MSAIPEDLIYMAKIYEQIERYEDMVECMKSLATDKLILNEEERNLLSAAFKYKAGSRRTAWRTLASIEKQEEAKTGSTHLPSYQTVQI